jgi:hypothetical protein
VADDPEVRGISGRAKDLHRQLSGTRSMALKLKRL